MTDEQVKHCNDICEKFETTALYFFGGRISSVAITYDDDESRNVIMIRKYLQYEPGGSLEVIIGEVRPLRKGEIRPPYHWARID